MCGAETSKAVGSWWCWLRGEAQTPCIASHQERNWNIEGTSWVTVKIWLEIPFFFPQSISSWQSSTIWFCCQFILLWESVTMCQEKKKTKNNFHVHQGPENRSEWNTLKQCWIYWHAMNLRGYLCVYFGQKRLGRKAAMRSQNDLPCQVLPLLYAWLQSSLWHIASMWKTSVLLGRLDIFVP